MYNKYTHIVYNTFSKGLPLCKEGAFPILMGIYKYENEICEKIAMYEKSLHL